MKRKFKLELLILILIITFFPVRNMFSQGGGAAVPFLRIAPDARASGMGETGTAIADDINAVYWNPAGLAFHDYIPDPFETYDEPKPYRQIALAFSPWLPQFNADLFYSYGAYAQFFEDLDGTVAFNFLFMNLGEFIRTAENGQQLGKFISNEFAIGVSYGTIIAEDFGVGFQLKYIQSNLAPANIGQTGAGTGISAAFDLGLLWKPLNLDIFGWDAGDLFSIGMNLQNIGPKVTYRSESDPLPTTLRGGIAIYAVSDEFNDLTFAMDVAKLLVKRESVDGKTSTDPLPISLITGWENPGAEFSIGAEYWYERIFAFRAGYFTEPSALGDRKYWNFGAGVRFPLGGNVDMNIDFSYINTIEENHPLANTMRVSFIFDWK